MRKGDNAKLFSAPVSEMSEDERAAHISDNELIRAHITERMERVLVLLSRETGNRKYRKRRHKLGKSPNDI